MNSIEDIFIIYPDSWLEALPKYQKNVIIELYSQSGDYEKAALAWLNASMSTNVPFGTEKGHSLFYDKLVDEVEAFFSGDDRYKDSRLAILKESSPTQTYIVGAISVALSPILGAAATFLAPIIAIVLLTIAKMGINAWLAMRKEQHSNTDQNRSLDAPN